MSGLVVGAFPDVIQHGRYDHHLSIAKSDGLSFVIGPLGKK